MKGTLQAKLPGKHVTDTPASIAFGPGFAACFHCSSIAATFMRGPTRLAEAWRLHSRSGRCPGALSLVRYRAASIDPETLSSAQSLGLESRVVAPRTVTGDHEERSQALFARSAPTGRSVAIFFRSLEHATERDAPPVLRLSLISGRESVHSDGSGEIRCNQLEGVGVRVSRRPSRVMVSTRFPPARAAPQVARDAPGNDSHVAQSISRPGVSRHNGRRDDRSGLPTTGPLGCALATGRTAISAPRS